MARVEQHQAILPSIIDRLIDAQSGGTRGHAGYTVRQMIAAVHRDLDDLLNTRQSHAGLPEAFVELNNSIMAFGLPDLTTLTVMTPSDRMALGHLLEKIIQKFEPRLRDVRVHLIDETEEQMRTLRFQIDARLCLDPAPEVNFDTVLELGTGHYTIKQGAAQP